MLHLIEMVVAQLQRIEGRGRQSRITVGILKLSDHVLSPTRVAGNGETGHRIVRGQHPHLYQRGYRGEKAGGVAPGVCHPLGKADTLTLTGEQFGKAVHPARRSTVGWRGIDDAGVGVIHQLHRLGRRLLRETQNSQVRLVEQLAPLFHISAFLRVNHQKVQVAAAGQLLIQPRSYHAALSVNKYLWVLAHEDHPFKWCKRGGALSVPHCTPRPS